ncbi:hypothetical protein GGE48_006489 [Rhizobium leguminosarum]|nr:hypothetical protein [Rhizobium leguminosarum]
MAAGTRAVNARSLQDTGLAGVIANRTIRDVALDSPVCAPVITVSFQPNLGCLIDGLFALDQRDSGIHLATAFLS